MSSLPHIGKGYLRIFQELQFQRVSRKSLLRAANSMGIPPQQVIRARKRYLNDCLKKLRIQLKLYHKDLENFRPWEMWAKLTHRRIELIHKKLAEIKMDYRSLDYDLGDDNFGEKIAQAKKVPIGVILNQPTTQGMMLTCPFHEDKHPSLKVNKDNSWYCFQCGEHGDSIDMIIKLYSFSFKEAVERLLNDMGGCRARGAPPYITRSYSL